MRLPWFMHMAPGMPSCLVFKKNLILRKVPGFTGERPGRIGLGYRAAAGRIWLRAPSKKRKSLHSFDGKDGVLPPVLEGGPHRNKVKGEIP